MTERHPADRCRFLNNNNEQCEARRERLATLPTPFCEEHGRLFTTPLWTYCGDPYCTTWIWSATGLTRCPTHWLSSEPCAALFLGGSAIDAEREGLYINEKGVRSSRDWKPGDAPSRFCRWVDDNGSICSTRAHEHYPFCVEHEALAGRRVWKWCPAHPKSGQCRVWVQGDVNLAHHPAHKATYLEHGGACTDLTFMGGSHEEANKQRLYFSGFTMAEVAHNPMTGKFEHTRPAQQAEPPLPPNLPAATVTFFLPCCGDFVTIEIPAMPPGPWSCSPTCSCGVKLELIVHRNALGEFRPVFSEAFYRRHSPAQPGSR